MTQYRLTQLNSRREKIDAQAAVRSAYIILLIVSLALPLAIIDVHIGAVIIGSNLSVFIGGILITILSLYMHRFARSHLKIDKSLATSRLIDYHQFRLLRKIT